MIRRLCFAFMLCSSTPAFALSCLAPEVARSYDRFAADPADYVIVRGRISLEGKLPRALSPSQSFPDVTLVPARLVGKSLTQEGFRLPFDKELTLEVSCLGPWCGSLADGEDVLAFVRRSEGAYYLAVPPCGGSAFGAPKAAQIKRVKLCHQRGVCPSVNE
ncbi:MAG: hypothetical protein AAF943_13870 [Pseudomonadota bacterium]